MVNIKTKQTIKKKGVSVQLFPAPMLCFLSALTQTVGVGAFITGSLSEPIAKVL